MKMKRGMEGLFRAVLAVQDEDGRGAELTEERVRDVLLGLNVFTADEERMLATSPLARDTYAEVVEDLQIERQVFEERHKAAGLKTSTSPLLVAESEQDLIEIVSDDFSVTVRSHPVSDEWIITLKLHDRFREIVRAEDVLTLVDDTDVTWVRGQVNDYGEIHSYCWPCKETPAERIKKQGFALNVRYG
jgi:hypothetical protein